MDNHRCYRGAALNIKTSKSQKEIHSDQSNNLLPFGIEISADTITPITAFLNLRESGSKEAFLLESADGGESVGRYTYIGKNVKASPMNNLTWYTWYSLFRDPDDNADDDSDDEKKREKFILNDNVKSDKIFCN